MSGVLSIFFKKLLSEKGIIFFCITSVFISLILAILLFIEVCIFDCPVYVYFLNLIRIFNFNVWIGFTFDALATFFLLVVVFISFLIHIYSIGYMKNDPYRGRFFILLNFFTFFMLFTILSDNLVQMLIGWDGVGICSYLLISFWHSRFSSVKAGLHAFFINTFGDIGLIIAIILLQWNMRTIVFDGIFLLAPFFKTSSIIVYGIKLGYLDFVCFCLFFGGLAKSAQIGLHTWLPSAMEGPTPVSALIHAATMVTLGVYLIIRCSPLFELSSNVLNIISIFGILTAFFGALIATTLYDIKKIVAYSTLSQIGYMFCVCGLSGYKYAFFHLVVHAFCKAFLFLSVGCLFYINGGKQDIRDFYKNISPTLLVLIFLAILSLAGLFPISGFYSKELILKFSAASYTLFSDIIFFIGSLTCGLTCIYSCNIIRLLCPSPYVKLNSNKVPFIMLIPVVILCFFSVFLGGFLLEIFGPASNFFNDSIVEVYDAGMYFLPSYIKLFPFICSYFAIFIFKPLDLKLFSTYYYLFEKRNFVYRVSKGYYYNFISNHSLLFLLFFWFYFFVLEVFESFFEILGPRSLVAAIFKVTEDYFDNIEKDFYINIIEPLLIFLTIFTCIINIWIY